MPFDTHLLDEAIALRSDRLENERQRLFAKTVALLDAHYRQFGIRFAYIFGSVTRPRRFHQHSDVDIAIETSRPELLAEAIGRFSSRLERTWTWSTLPPSLLPSASGERGCFGRQKFLVLQTDIAAQLALIDDVFANLENRAQDSMLTTRARCS